MSTVTRSRSHISNPRRILVLTPSAQSSTTIPPFLHCLTGFKVTETRNTAPERATTDAETESKKQKEPAAADGGGTISFAGYTTHSPLRLDTKYYTADVPIWVDEVPLSTSPPPSAATPPTSSSGRGQQSPNPSTWESEFLSAEARDVRDAVAAIIICIRPPEPVSTAVPSNDAAAVQGRKDVDAQVARLKDFIGVVTAVKEKIDEERGGMGDVAGLLVLVQREKERGQSRAGEGSDYGGGPEEEEAASLEAREFGRIWWDQELNDMGVFDFETVSWCPGEHPEGTGGDEELRRNEFGELEGMARIREILEANEWSSTADDDDDADDLQQSLLGDADTRGGFDLEASQLEREMLDLRMAIENGGDDGIDDDDKDIEDDQLEALMLRVQAIRDMGSDLPEAERKKFAAKAIRDIMKDV